MINPNNELFRWGPIPGRPIYTFHFMDAIAERFPGAYVHRWPELLVFFKGDKITAICDYAELRSTGKRLFTTWMLDDAAFAKLKEMYARAVERLEGVHAKIELLHEKSEQELAALYGEWQAAFLSFWAHGLVPEFANFGGEQLLREELEKVTSKRDFLRAFERLAAPEQLSFYLEEELDLLKLKQQEKTPSFARLLVRHAKNYSWINNSYFESVVLDEAYFRKRLEELGSKQVEEEIQKIISLPEKTRNEKAAVVQEFHLGEDLPKTAERLGYCIYWQDARKKQIFKTLHHIRVFIDELARRTGRAAGDLEFCSGAELAEVIDGGGPSAEEIARRKDGFLIHYDNGLELVTGKRFDEMLAPFLTKQVDSGVRELKGLPVSFGKGTVTGRAKILLSPKQLGSMNEGDVLIAPMTSPEFILAMRKAAAIVTDEGGMTSHAAIVSRELNIPCIVGTKAATLVFRDGDTVEVDVEAGVVRKK